MSIKKTTNPFVVGFLAAVLLGASGYALTNSIAYQDASQLAGTGSQPVQSLTVTNTDYNLNTTDRSKFDSIVFTVSPAIRVFNADAKAYVRINTGASWSLCTAPADLATTVTCPFGTPGNVAEVGTPGGNVDLVLAE